VPPTLAPSLAPSDRPTSASHRRRVTERTPLAAGPGTNCSALATAASWSASTRNASAPGIHSKRLTCRRTGTTGSRIVITTAVATSTSPIQSLAEKEPMALPASSTIRQSWMDGLLHGPRFPLARLALQVELLGEPVTRACGGVTRASAASPVRPRNDQPLLAAIRRSTARWRTARDPSTRSRGAATRAGRPGRPSSSRPGRIGRWRARRRRRRRRRRSPRAGTPSSTAGRCRGPGGRRRRRGSAHRVARSTEPVEVGRGGPAVQQHERRCPRWTGSSRTWTVPRPGSSISRPGGNHGVGASGSSSGSSSGGVDRGHPGPFGSGRLDGQHGHRERSVGRLVGDGHARVTRFDERRAERRGRADDLDTVRRLLLGVDRSGSARPCPRCRPRRRSCR
jgi:hypothetical protein